MSKVGIIKSLKWFIISNSYRFSLLQNYYKHFKYHLCVDSLANFSKNSLNDIINKINNCKTSIFVFKKYANREN